MNYPWWCPSRSTCTAASDVRPHPHPQAVRNRMARRISQIVCPCLSFLSNILVRVVPVCPNGMRGDGPGALFCEYLSQSRAMGDARKTDAISLEVFLEVEVRIGHSHYIQQALGAKDSVHSQASFCNAEGNENWKETSRRGVRSYLRYRGQCGNGQMRSCASGLESPHIPSAFHPVSVLFASSRV